MKRTLIVDADTIVYSSAAMQQDNKCLATHKASSRQKLFDSKTEFNNWIKSQEKWTKEEFEFETVSSVIGEPHFAFQTIKQKVENIVDASGCDDYLLCIEGEGNFRKDLNSKYVSYKSHRPQKPILFEECRDFFLKKYKGKVKLAEQIETDDVVTTLGWGSYNKALASKDKSKANLVVAYCDKDIAANCRGWLLNYNKLDQGIFWNDGLTQEINFGTQMLTGDSADAIPGIQMLSDEVRAKYGIKTKGVGPATAEKILSGCTTEREVATRVVECYYSTYPEDWKDRLFENGFFLYLLRHEQDKWDVEKYIGGAIADV